MLQQGSRKKWVFIGAGLLAAAGLISAWLPSLTPAAAPGLQKTHTPRPTVSATEAVKSSPTPSPTPTRAPRLTPAPGTQPAQADFLFIEPRNGAEVLSPIRIEAEMNPGFAGSVRLELVNTEGRVLSRKVFLSKECARETKAAALQRAARVDPSTVCVRQPGRLRTDLIFGLGEERGRARLQLVLVDEDQHVRNLSSVGLTLLSDGKPDAGRLSAPEAPITILQPAREEKIRTKSLVVSGTAPQTGDLPLRVEIVSANGVVLSSRMASAIPPVESDDANGLGVFRVDVLIKKLKAPTQALVVVSAPDEIVPGMKAVVSREIFLDLP